MLRTVWTGIVATKTVSVYDPWGHPVAEYDSDTNTLLREYVWLGDRPVAVVEGGDIFCIHVDHIERPVMATDASATVVWSAAYYPFGGISQVHVDTGALTAQELRFPGQWFQAGEPDRGSLRWSDPPANGFHQNWHRTYDPMVGRYLEPDPLGLVDGPSVHGYAMQSPLRYVDPELHRVAFTLGRTLSDGSIRRADKVSPGDLFRRQYGQRCQTWTATRRFSQIAKKSLIIHGQQRSAVAPL